MFDTAPKALVANGFAIPRANIFKIICKYSQTQSAQMNVTAWFTGHPNFKHVMINTIDDERMQGAINALKQNGRFNDALTISTGADGLGQKQIRPASRVPRSRTSRSATASGSCRSSRT